MSYTVNFASGGTETGSSYIVVDNTGNAGIGPTGPGGAMLDNFFGPPTAAGTVTGTVTGPNGELLPGPGVASCPAPSTSFLSCPGLVTAVTDASGHYTLSLPPGTYNLVGFDSVNGQPIASPVVYNVTLTAGQTITENFVVTPPATASGTVTDRNGMPLPNSGVVACPAPSTSFLSCPGREFTFADPTGHYTLPLVPGSYNMAGFAFIGLPGQPVLSLGVQVTVTLGQAITENFVIPVPPIVATTLTYSGPTLVANGTTAQLQGRLLTAVNSPVVGRTITLSLGTQSCTAPTDATGTGTCAVSVSQTLGPINATASFAGDSSYQPSQASPVSGFVFANTSGGNFVIGDQNSSVGNAVTFWGAQWSQQEAELFLGVPPKSFKGFANTPATAPNCTTQWSTDPGNSSGPPATVDSYVAVIVTNASPSPDRRSRGTPPRWRSSRPTPTTQVTRDTPAPERSSQSYPASDTYDGPDGGGLLTSPISGSVSLLGLDLPSPLRPPVPP